VPFTIATLSDCHIGATWGIDPTATLEAVVDTVRATLAMARPDAVVVTGDIAHTPTRDEYEGARTLLERLGAPVFALPGNHDNRELLRGSFGLPASGSASGNLSYIADLGPVRLVALDTKQPGTARGRLEPERLEWLARVLAEDRVTPTLVAMHHPPIATGVPALDAIGIADHERAALAELLARHPQVGQIVAGHVHRTIAGTFGGRPVLAIPSTSAQLALDFEAPDVRVVLEPPCFALHLLLDGLFVTHVAPVLPV
jgi:3',5'-cyclic AMP phosphodiesterase CpdA